MKKIIIYFSLLVIVVISTAAGLWGYHKYQNRRLTVSDMQTLDYFYGMKINPAYQEGGKYGEKLNYSKGTIKATEHTKQVVDVMNFYIFDIHNELKAKDLAEDYGLSYEKRITVDWLEDHLHEGIEIRNRLTDKGVILVTDEWTRHCYQLIHSDNVYTSAELSYVELEIFCRFFRIKPDISSYANLGNEDVEQDYSNMTFDTTESNMEDVIEAMNIILFEFSSSKKATKKAERMGLSKENPITIKWVLSNPKEALEIKDLMEDHGASLFDLDQVSEYIR